MTQLAKKAAMAIINSTANPALHIETKNVTGRNLATIIDRETCADDLLEALEALLPLASQEAAHLADDDMPEDAAAAWTLIEQARAAIAKAKGGAA